MLNYINEDIVHSLRLSPLKTFANIQEAKDSFKNGVTVVYSLINGNNIYVGSTTNIRSRLIKHLSDYRIHYGKHPKLHKLFDAVGIDNVKVFIYEEDAGTDLDQIIYGGKLNTKARLIELAYMIQFQTYGMNILSSDIYFNREETYKKISEARRGIPQLHRRVLIKQYSLDGELLAEYDSISIAADETGIDQASISRSSFNQCKHAGGYLWKR